MKTVWNIWTEEDWVISVRQPVVGKHMSVKPAAEKTREAQKRREEEEEGQGKWEI